MKLEEVQVTPDFDEIQYDIIIKYIIIGIDVDPQQLSFVSTYQVRCFLVNFSNLDFDQIKGSIQDYLRANSNFTDYDFEGSNLSTIINTLAYNTYITSYNAIW